MSTNKKSLINTIKTTKKAKVASTPMSNMEVKSEKQISLSIGRGGLGEKKR